MHDLLGWTLINELACPRKLIRCKQHTITASILAHWIASIVGLIMTKELLHVLNHELSPIFELLEWSFVLIYLLGFFLIWVKWWQSCRSMSAAVLAFFNFWQYKEVAIIRCSLRCFAFPLFLTCADWFFFSFYRWVIEWVINELFDFVFKVELKFNLFPLYLPLDLSKGFFEVPPLLILDHAVLIHVFLLDLSHPEFRGSHLNAAAFSRFSVNPLQPADPPVLLSLLRLDHVDLILSLLSESCSLLGNVTRYHGLWGGLHEGVVLEVIVRGNFTPLQLHKLLIQT